MEWIVVNRVNISLVLYISWFSTFSTLSFFGPRIIPKVLILGQSHTSISQTVKFAVN